MDEEVATPHGPARLRWSGLAAADTRPRGLLLLGPGASGTVATADLAAAVEVATGAGLAAALVEPSYRVAGRKVPPRGPSVDESWMSVVAHARDLVPSGPLIVGGRSFGGRVAARNAHATGASAVLCLAYPLHPPGKPERSRLAELDAADPLPVLAISGERDPFGRPEPGGNRQVVVVPGDHGLKSGLVGLRAALTDWLAARLG